MISLLRKALLRTAMFQGEAQGFLLPRFQYGKSCKNSERQHTYNVRCLSGACSTVTHS